MYCVASTISSFSELRSTVLVEGLGHQKSRTQKLQVVVVIYPKP